MTADMEIICVGNELLIGKTLNTNAQWIAKQATSIGITVKRITVIADEITEIATATAKHSAANHNSPSPLEDWDQPSTTKR